MNIFLTSVAYAAEQEMTAGGIAALGIDARALFFQVLNFAILLVVLRLVAYKPILKILDARRAKIEESLKNASDVESIKNQMAVEKDAVLKQALQEAQALLAQTRQQANQIVKQAEQQAVKQAKQAVAQTQKQISQEVTAAQTQLKEELVALVAQAAAKVAAIKIDAVQDEEIIRQGLAEARLTTDAK